jgi:hypothetical protein
MNYDTIYCNFSVGAIYKYTIKPGYNDIGLCDISLIESDILWYQLIRHC